MAEALSNSMTRAEYLAYDEAAPEKYEFLARQIFAMSGGTFNHATIGLNAAATLRNQLRGKPCQPLNSDMRIHTPSGLDTYPDVSVYCGQPELSDNERTLNNPVLIIEVLSPSTLSYDRGDKFWHYRSISSLQDYILIDSTLIHVEHYHRQDRDQWSLHEYHSQDAELHLPALGISLRLSDCYEGVTVNSG
jgi:Uma2 family endonuclease